MSYPSHKRRLVLSAHTRQKASNQPCSPCCKRCQGHTTNDRSSTEQRAAQSFPQNRTTRISSHKSPRCRYREGRYDGTGPSTSNKTWCHSATAVYECLGAKKGTSKQGVPISYSASALFTSVLSLISLSNLGCCRTLRNDRFSNSGS